MAAYATMTRAVALGAEMPQGPRSSSGLWAAAALSPPIAAGVGAAIGYFFFGRSMMSALAGGAVGVVGGMAVGAVSAGAAIATSAMSGASGYSYSMSY